MAVKICLVLTSPTLEEDLQIVARYQKDFPSIGIVELRVDMLKPDEVFCVHKFPALVSLPVILTIRRQRDGGEFRGGEYARALMFSRCLNMKNENEKTFSYIDLEDDFCASELEYICDILKIKVVRSHHSINEPILEYEPIIERIKGQKYDVIKIASFSSCLSDTKRLFQLSEKLKGEEHVLVAMGEMGFASRILSEKLSNSWNYAFAHSEIERRGLMGKMPSPEALLQDYNFDRIDDGTKLFGIIGRQVNTTLSPPHHNGVFREKNLPCAYIPLCAQNIGEALDMARFLHITALSVTAPFKIEAMQYANALDESAKMVLSCNTLTFFYEKKCEKVVGYNTDVIGFDLALKEFLGDDYSPSLKVCVLGAGGAARAVCHVLKQNGFRDVLILNRTFSKAEALARIYGYETSFLDSSSVPLLKDYADLIINATSIGKLGGDGGDVDLLPFYNFSGIEKVFDLVYNLSSGNKKLSPLLQRAVESGCKVCDGSLMFYYQALAQEQIFKDMCY